MKAAIIDPGGEVDRLLAVIADQGLTLETKVARFLFGSERRREFQEANIARLHSGGKRFG